MYVQMLSDLRHQKPLISKHKQFYEYKWLISLICFQAIFRQKKKKKNRSLYPFARNADF